MIKNPMNWSKVEVYDKLGRMVHFINLTTALENSREKDSIKKAVENGHDYFLGKDRDYIFC